MLLKKAPDDNPKILDLIIQIETNMLGVSPETPEYAKMLDHLERLNKVRNSAKKEPRVSADTLVLVAGNLAGIGLILSYERLNIVTTKALGFVGKFRP